MIGDVAERAVIGNLFEDNVAVPDAKFVQQTRVESVGPVNDGILNRLGVERAGIAQREGVDAGIVDMHLRVTAENVVVRGQVVVDFKITLIAIELAVAVGGVVGGVGDVHRVCQSGGVGRESEEISARRD